MLKDLLLNNGDFSQMNNKIIVVAKWYVEKEELLQYLGQEKAEFSLDIDYEGTILPAIKRYHQEKNLCIATCPLVTCVMCLTNELRTRCTLST